MCTNIFFDLFEGCILHPEDFGFVMPDERNSPRVNEDVRYLHNRDKFAFPSFDSWNVNVKM
ncbi:MAG: hypothetical protein ACRCX5_08915 [Bacteroidales bacterium]